MRLEPKYSINTYIKYDDGVLVVSLITSIEVFLSDTVYMYRYGLDSGEYVNEESIISSFTEHPVSE